MAIRVLVADDEPAITDVASQGLAAAGFEVLEAHDGPEALDLARQEDPDVILLDVMMPGMDGRDVCRRIKIDPALSDRPVVLFSSLSESDVDWREAGADAYLQKVFNVMELPDFLRELVGRQDE